MYHMLFRNPQTRIHIYFAPAGTQCDYYFLQQIMMDCNIDGIRLASEDCEWYIHDFIQVWNQ